MLTLTELCAVLMLIVTVVDLCVTIFTQKK